MMPTSQILTKTFSAEGTGKNTAQDSRKRAISSEMFQFCGEEAVTLCYPHLLLDL